MTQTEKIKAALEEMKNSLDVAGMLPWEKEEFLKKIAEIEETLAKVGYILDYVEEQISPWCNR